MITNRLNLGLKFSIAVTALIICSMVVVASLIINFQKDSLRQSTFENNLSVTRHLADDAPEPLLVFDPLRLDELVSTVMGATSCVYAMITDSTGRIVAHTDRSMLGRELTGREYPELREHLVAGQELIRQFSSGDTAIKEFSVPVRIRNEILGLATVGYSMEKIDSVIESRLSKLKKYIYLITGIMVMVGIMGASMVSSLLTKPLKKLKGRMLNVQAGDLDVQVENPRIVKCWERLDCSKTDCPSYGKLRCWSVAGTFCHGEVQGQFAQKIGDCRKCIVYKESCGDEINELVEVFNQMVKDLEHNLRELDKVNVEKARMERLSALGEMATTVAHETKNPLNSIRLATSYLKRNFSGDILTEFLTIIEEEVNRLNDITSNFLGFSRPAPLKMKVCDINAIAKSTVELIRQEATERNIEIVILTDENIPPVECDFARIKQTLLNLLMNSLDASKQGDTITITTESHNSHVELSVRDTGAGMPAEEIEKIFKPFYTTKTRGSGLGLAIVERVVKEHKGEILVESALERGTTFTVKLPVGT